MNPGDLGPGRRLMTWEEVAELKAMGHAIGAHGMTHARLSGLEGDALRAEIHQSSARIEAMLGAPTPWYAHAFGDVDSVSAGALSMVGEKFPLCRSGVRGVNRPDSPALALRADHVDLAAPPAYARLVAAGGLDALYAGRRRMLDAKAPR